MKSFPARCCPIRSCKTRSYDAFQRGYERSHVWNLADIAGALKISARVLQAAYRGLWSGPSGQGCILQTDIHGFPGCQRRRHHVFQHRAPGCICGDRPCAESSMPSPAPTLSPGTYSVQEETLISSMRSPATSWAAADPTPAMPLCPVHKAIRPTLA